jgi:pepF/M3 family oligoendopeptidase
MSAEDMKTKTSKKAPRWDLEVIFPGGSSSVEYKTFRDKVRHDLAAAKATIAKLPPTLDSKSQPKWTKLISEFSRLGEHLGLARSYGQCLISENVADDLGHAIFAEVDMMVADWLNLKTALEAFSLKQSDSAWEKLVTSPELAPVRFPLDELRTNAKEKMSPELETLAQELSVNGYHAWARLYDRISGDILVDFEEDGKVEKLSVGQLQNKYQHPDRAVRQKAFVKLKEAWNSRAALATTALNSQGGFRLSIYNGRGWKSALHEPLRMNRMEEATLNAMWRAVSKSIPQMAKYIDAKKRILGIDEFCWYDQLAPVGKVDVEFTFDQAGDFVVKHLGSFSDEMATFSRMALDQRWIEAEDRPGKADGGYCTGMNLRKQSRIFMTFSNDFGSMSTLAHELGHAYHQWVLKDTPYLATEYPMGLAETASIFNELRVTDAALQEVSDPQQKLMLLDQILQQAFSLFCNIYARFIFDKAFYVERAKGSVSRARLDELMVAAQKDAFAGILDPINGYHPLFWASKLHFFYTEMPFYNFPYTFGYLFAGGVYEIASREGKAFAPKYRALLQDTGSMTTEQVAAKHLGVDLTQDDFWTKAVQRSVTYVDDFCLLVDKLK